MDPKEALLHGVLPPAAITLIFLLVSWRPWKRTGSPSGAWGSAWGIALGYLAADLLIRKWHGVLPAGGSLYHPHIALAAAAVFTFLPANKHAILRIPAAILLTAGASALILKANLQSDAKAALPYLVGATLAGLVMWTCVATAAGRSIGARIPLMLWAAAAGASLILLQSGAASLAQMAGALAASMGVFVILGWARPQIPAIRSAVPVYVLVMLGLLIAGRGFASPWEPADWPIALAALAVASPIVTLVPPIRKLKPWLGTVIGLVVTLVICAVGLALTKDGFDFSGFK